MTDVLEDRMLTTSDTRLRDLLFSLPGTTSRTSTRNLLALLDRARTFAAAGAHPIRGTEIAIQAIELLDKQGAQER